MHEKHTEGYAVSWKVNDVLHSEQTNFQHLSIVDTLEWGKTLVLDGMLQVSEKDEYIYHEMIVHIALNAHPSPSKVLIIGGGDGGTLREVIRHEDVKKADIVEIDERVVENSKVYFPSLANSFNDPRVSVLIEDGVEFVKNTNSKYDVVIVDSSDPIGPAKVLFSQGFYQEIFNILNDDGIMVVQSESPIFYEEIFKTIQNNIKAVFPDVYIYLASIPTYVSGPWSFTIGSKQHDPRKISDGKKDIDALQYYNKNIHTASFVLPQFILNIIK